MLVILTMIGPDVISEACWIKWPTTSSPRPQLVWRGVLWWHDEQTWQTWSPKPQTSTRASEPEVKTICCSSEKAAGKMAVTWTVPVSVCRYVWSTSDVSVKMWNCQKAWGVTEFKTCSQNILVLHATGIHLSSHQAGPYPSSKWRWCRWSPWS